MKIPLKLDINSLQFADKYDDHTIAEKLNEVIDYLQAQEGFQPQMISRDISNEEIAAALEGLQDKGEVK